MPVLILLVVVAGGIGGWKVYQERLVERQKREALSPAGTLVGHAGCSRARSQ